jgi:hypothetical protein
LEPLPLELEPSFHLKVPIIHCFGDIIVNPLVKIVELHLMARRLLRTFGSKIHFSGIFALKLLHEELRLIKDLAEEE